MRELGFWLVQLGGKWYHFLRYEKWTEESLCVEGHDGRGNGYKKLCFGRLICSKCVLDM
jgi:hypothetical protein